MRAETAVAVMVLAVHVGRDHAADGHELRPRHDRREITARHERGEDVGEQHARFHREEAARRVESAEAVEPARRQGDALADGGVAVGAPVAARDEARMPALQRRHRGRRLRLEPFARVPRIASPSGQLDHALRSRNVNAPSSMNLAT